MSYQALLFCPDEKTARTVTQVLSELEFSVTPCTEPFAAVKQLMNERFDAVVVDCDNEQNATLLFKSARNTPNNQSALAVAVVEGQAGVAKAFRIGANLVLTKPINVEQAKGTLRVARGLLRKSEGAKTAPAATSMTVRSAPAVVPPPAPQRPAQHSSMSNSKNELPAEPLAPVIAPGAFQPSMQKPAPQPTAVTLAPANVLDDDALEIANEARVSEQPAKHSIDSAPKIVSSAVSSGTSAASAVAPAREAKVATEQKAVVAIPEVAPPAKKIPVPDEKSVSSEPSAPAPLTFSGTISTTAEIKHGGNKKALVAVVALIVIAAGAYGAWMQWGHMQGSMSAPAHTAAPAIPAPEQNAASSASVAASTPAAAQSNQHSELSQESGHPKISDDKPAGSKGKSHANVSDEAAPSNSSAAPEKKTVAKAAAPIMIKNAARSSANDAPALSITNIAGAGSGGSLPNLMGTSKAPTPTLQRLNISQGVSRGLLIKQVQPIYPPNALRMRIEGTVQLMATLSKNGDIAEVKIQSGDPQLAQAAASAVKQWKYKPYLLNGEPVEIQTQITVNFKLPH
jgi:TonB family protein